MKVDRGVVLRVAHKRPGVVGAREIGHRSQPERTRLDWSWLRPAQRLRYG